MRTPKLVLGVFVAVAAVGAVYWASPPARRPVRWTDDPGDHAAPPQPAPLAQPADASPPPSAEVLPHPLLGSVDEAAAVCLAEALPHLRSTADAKLAEVIRAVQQSASGSSPAASLTIDYPQDETIFPAEIVAPTFLWHEPVARADTWLIDVSLGEPPKRIAVLSPGPAPPSGPVDPRCIAPTNELYRPTPYQASARSWTPDAELWAAIKHGSRGRAATITILGFHSGEPGKLLSRGRISLTTSPDPVGAPIFYRDVPLAPSLTQEGVIKPLSDGATSLIAWRLRDLSQPESRLLVTDVPTCTNCHSFSTDGKTLGMDLDGPQGDKGAYAITSLAKQTVVQAKDVISWNSFPGKPMKHKTVGFLSQVSPDGRFVVSTVNESVYVRNFLDYRFLQVFYPTRGILASYCRATGQIQALPGADDPQYVHCDPVWTPDGQTVIFARAAAKDPYQPGEDAQRANDPAERQIQYDLCRIPFRDGLDGKAEPIAGASGNGMSNNFPKVSPDGKWIVFVQCSNGQLMRPDSTLWIVPVEGGTPRRMRCNTNRMNSWHSFSPNGRWMVFSSKANTPYTQMFLTHIGPDGADSPAVLIPNSTAANRAVNIPEFVHRPYEELLSIQVPAVEYVRHAIRGVQLGRDGKYDQALAELDAAVAIQPDFVQGHLDAARILADQGKLDAARLRLAKVLEIDPHRSRAHDIVGKLLLDQGRHAEAETHFRLALEGDPNYLSARSSLIRLLLKQGRQEEAHDHLRAAITSDSREALGRLELGKLLLQREMPEEALRQFRTAVEIDSYLIDAHVALAKLLVARQEFRAAVAQLEKAAEIEPNNIRPVADLAWLLAVCPQDDIRDGKRAVALARRACAATNSSSPVLLSTLAAACAETANFAEAIATANQALTLVNPQDPLAQSIRQQLECYRQHKPLRPL